MATVGQIIRSIFLRSLRSATGSNWKSGCPYLGSQALVECSLTIQMGLGSVLIGRNLASCSCIVCQFIGVLLLGEAVFAVHGSHRCNDTPVIGVCLAFVKFQPVGGLSGADPQTLSRIDK